jgi:hypothetical protein
MENTVASVKTKTHFTDSDKLTTALIYILRAYIDDPNDIGYNGASSINGAPLKTKNPKTIENFLKWLEK